MEADSTTIERDYNYFYDKQKKSSLINQISEHSPFFRDVIEPMLKPGYEGELIEWMKDTKLIPCSVKCTKNLSGCYMHWTPTRVVDKYQWQCNFCNQKINIRENSFFKNVYCTLPATLKIILAWCQDVDFEVVSVALGIKKQVINSLYDKIERFVFKIPNIKMGGPGSVTLVELYPDFVEELYPVSSRDDLKSHVKILCLVDTKKVPSRYYFHVITGTHIVTTENNNTSHKKLSLSEEILSVLDKNTFPGGFCAIGSGSQLAEVQAALKAKGKHGGLTSTANVMSSADKEMQSFIRDIWRTAVQLCDAAQDLPKNKMQSYLHCALWRRERESSDVFLSVINLISQLDSSAFSKLQK